MDTVPNTFPDPEALRCFIAAAELANFRNAARRVHVTPSAFSKRIRMLEEMIGGPLFRRTTRRVELSVLGEVLLPRARAALASLATCVDGEQEPEAALRGEFAIGSRHELALSWLLPFVERLEHEHAGVTVQIIVSSGPDLFAQLLRGEIDAFVSSQRFSDRSLDFESLHAESYAFVGSSKLLKQKPFKKSADAAEHVLLDTTRELPLYRYAREAGAPFAENFAAVKLRGSIALLREQVLAGEGLAVLPEYFVAKDLARDKLTRVLPSLALPVDTFRLVFRRVDERRRALREIAAQMRGFSLR